MAFPLPDNKGPRISQDALIYHEADDWALFHTELNTFGLYFYRESLLRTGQRATPPAVILGWLIFCRLDQFIDSAIKFFNSLKYWGPLLYKVRLDSLSGCGLVKYPPSGPIATVYYCLDTDIEVCETILAADLPSQKSLIILRSAQRIAWGFNWDLAPEVLEDYYEAKKPKT